MILSDIINHVRDREYMSGVERDKIRIKSTGEVFTPTPLVQEVLDALDQHLFVDPTKTFLDNCCGDGQFLGDCHSVCLVTSAALYSSGRFI